MPKNDKFLDVFNRLKEILVEYEPFTDVKVNTSDQYYLDTYKVNPINNKMTFFAAAKIQKDYVSFYLISVYAYPELLSNISDPLKIY